MRVVELFAGVGGFRLGLERAGHRVVWSNEWDKYAGDTYDKNFPGAIDRRDLTTVSAAAVPAHDLICGGFPCQAFSVAGKRRGFEETRGTLFFEIVRLARYHRTPYLLLENVKGLLSHDQGRTFATILATLDGSGYDCQWQVLNSKDFGVPQNRERIFIVGHLRGKPRPQVFPLIQTYQDAYGSRSQEGQELANTLRAKGSGGWGTNVEDTFIVVDGKPSSTRRGFIKEGYAGTLEANGNQVVARTIRIGGNGSPHGSRQNWDSYEIEGRIRRLTPVECERLQGFPDNWTQGVSDTQRYKQMGNAVTVNVIEAIAQRLPVGI